MQPSEALDPPSPAVVVERLRTAATTWVNAVALQSGRIDRRYHRPDQQPEVLEVDLHFLLIALVRLRRCVQRVAQRVPELAAVLEPEVCAFDAAVPSLTKLRNVSEHVDEYNLDAGRNATVNRRDVQVWRMDTNDDGGLVWGWLGERLDVRAADDAAVVLYRRFIAECETWAQRHAI